jgi:opacity protein-like surface antigen
MKDAPVVYTPSANWYLRGDVGYSWMDAGELHAATTIFNSVAVEDTWSIGGGVGRYFGGGVRGDLTYEWRASTDVHGSANINTDFSLRSSLLLANLYYDFRPMERLTPYIGIGVGAAYHTTGGGAVFATCGAPCVYAGGRNWTPAAALMAGLSLRIDRRHAPVSIKDTAEVATPGRLHLDVGYRFLYLGDADTGSVVGVANATPGPRLDDITAHEIRVGLRWDIR